ncbi:hypothetical protein [Shinella sp. M31]|uniref:hypothetical protein n=1 Tax=Shinella sp. M31 TaxID=3368615 RepID=UPI003B9F083B
MTQAKSKAQPENQTDAEATVEMPFCGIIMPISAMGPYEKTHWDRVRLVLDEAITAAGYRPRLVSESEDIGVIHSRIVQNLYDDPIVVCDVSGKNANVMFELGLRLAFDKPTIVIIDDQTDYSFDTSPIEHIKYRADLRYDDVRALQKKVTEVIAATIDRKAKEPDYSPFIGHFGRFKVAGIGTEVIGSSDYIIRQINTLRDDIQRLSRSSMTEEERQWNAAIQIAQSVLLDPSLDITKKSAGAFFAAKLHSELRKQNIDLTEQEQRVIRAKTLETFKEQAKGIFG